MRWGGGRRERDFCKCTASHTDRWRRWFLFVNIYGRETPPEVIKKEGMLSKRIVSKEISWSLRWIIITVDMIIIRNEQVSCMFDFVSPSTGSTLPHPHKALLMWALSLIFTNKRIYTAHRPPVHLFFSFFPRAGQCETVLKQRILRMWNWKHTVHEKNPRLIAMYQTQLKHRLQNRPLSALDQPRRRNLV